MLTLSKPAHLRSGHLPGEPLWRRLPTSDEHGQLLADFMMIIPGLREKSAAQIRSTAQVIECVLRRHSHLVVYADLNLSINVLWVSLRPVPGKTLELASLIHTLVPEAKLVAQYWE